MIIVINSMIDSWRIAMKRQNALNKTSDKFVCSHLIQLHTGPHHISGYKSLHRKLPLSMAVQWVSSAGLHKKDIIAAHLKHYMLPAVWIFFLTYKKQESGCCSKG